MNRCASMCVLVIQSADCKQIHHESSLKGAVHEDQIRCGSRSARVLEFSK